MPAPTPTTITTPTVAPGVTPEPYPGLDPDRMCPTQKERTTRRLIEDL